MDWNHPHLSLSTGTTLRLDVWDGWKEFLMGCLLGQTLKVQRYLSNEGPVLKYGDKANAKLINFTNLS